MPVITVLIIKGGYRKARNRLGAGSDWKKDFFKTLLLVGGEEEGVEINAIFGPSFSQFYYW